jgi:hypothetical protein
MAALSIVLTDLHVVEAKNQGKLLMYSFKTALKIWISEANFRSELRFYTANKPSFKWSCWPKNLFHTNEQVLIFILNVYLFPWLVLIAN